MRFEYSYLLWLLIIPALMLVHYIWLEVKGRHPHFRVSVLTPWKNGSSRFLEVVRHFPIFFRTVTLVMIILAIARPVTESEMTDENVEGIDIALAMDVSTSMLARDFDPDRITASKNIAIDFIRQRPYDRMGIVVFAGESYTQCPLTTDKAALINLMAEVQTDIIEDGTAIGNGLATAVARLKESEAKSKVVILLTDGVNNRGEITPQMAADIAQTYGIRVYTIGVGADGMAKYPFVTPWGIEEQMVKVEIDEDLLKEIADRTGGRYFRATDNTKLAEIYSEINQMEKTKANVQVYTQKTDHFMIFAFIALLSVLLELLVNMVFLRRLP